MTQILNIEMTCAVCGCETYGSVLASVYSFGYCDLDFCPPHMVKHTFGSEINVCQNCHYVATNLSREVSDETKNFVLSDSAFKDEYSSYSVTAYKNLMRIALFEGRYHDAFAACLKAAWFNEMRGNIRDEFGSCNPAIRIEALELFEKYEDELKYDEDTRLCLKADLLRRTMQFDETIAFVKTAHTMNWDVRCILAYQAYLAEKRDYQPHTIWSAKEWGRQNFYGKKNPEDDDNFRSQKTVMYGLSDVRADEHTCDDALLDDSEILPDNSVTQMKTAMDDRPSLWSRIFGKRFSK